MSARLRVACVGAGYFSQFHIGSWKRMGRVDLVGVCDTDAARAKASGAPAFTSLDRMIAEAAPDIIDIIAPPAAHAALLRQTMAAGVATVICQKPFCGNLNDARAITDVARASGATLVVHENFRFQRPNMLIEDILTEARIGTPTWARIAFRTAYDVYAGQPYLREEHRFILTDVGVHVLDLARVFLGEVSHLTAELQRRNPEVKGEDTATMMLRHSSGAVSLVECTYASLQTPDPFPATLIEIEGTRGALRLDADLTLTVSTDGAATSRSVVTARASRRRSSSGFCVPDQA